MKDLNSIQAYLLFLKNEEKSPATIEKYHRDIKAFMRFVNGRNIDKDLVCAYKNELIEKGYAPASINSMLSSLNSLFTFLCRIDLKVKFIKIQRKLYRSEERELTKDDYIKLIHTAEKNGNERLYLILQTICGTGIRVSELKFITVEAVKSGIAEISLKGKTRSVFIIRNLQKKLLKYIEKNDIKEGSVFITRSGKLINRVTIWREMKALCEKARVNPSKVFPHNLRHLFALVFYRHEKDIAKLADILGHSSIDTTRIYIISTGKEHRKCLENMRLVI